MIGLMAIFIACLMGYYVLRCFGAKNCPLAWENIFLMLGLGLGLSAQIVFYALLILDHIDPVSIIFAHLLVLGFLFFYYSRLPIAAHQTNNYELGSPWKAGVITIILILAGGIAFVLSQVRPWGDWDGWAYWNFHANFLFKAGNGWRRIFEFNIQAHHPWMLPLLIIGGWCFDGKVNGGVPLVLGIIFTVSTVGLLIVSLKKYIPFVWAVIAGLFLISIPFYIWQGTSQYADIEAAFFILLSCVLAVDLFKFPSVNNAVLAGLVLGLSAGLKENSIVAALLLMFLIINRLSQTGLRPLIRPLGWGFAATGLAVVIMRSFEFFPSYSHSYNVSWLGLWDWHKWLLMGRYAVKTLIAYKWGGLWLLAVAFIIIKRGWTKGETGFLLKFIVLYVIIYFFIFAGSALDLEWLLRVALALDRTLYLVAPTVIFIVFYVVGPKAESLNKRLE